MYDATIIRVLDGDKEGRSSHNWNLLFKCDWRPVRASVEYSIQCARRKNFYMAHRGTSYHIIHTLCRFHAPSDIVKKVIQMDPDATRQVQYVKIHPSHRGQSEALESSWQTMLPLHVACVYGSDADTISCLIHTYPLAVAKRILGKYPVQLYLEFMGLTAQSGAMKFLLAAYSLHEMTSTDEDDILLKTCRNLVHISENDELNESREEYWNVFSEIVDASRGEGERLTSSHASCLPLHRLMHRPRAVHFLINIGAMKYVVERYSDHLTKRDHAGNMPLHLLLGVSSIAQMKTEFTMSIMKEMLLQKPCLGCKADACGNLPLHLAIENMPLTDTSAIEILTKSAPHALRTRGGTSRLHPYMLAALNVCFADLSSVYFLLKNDPCAILDTIDSATKSDKGCLVRFRRRHKFKSIMVDTTTKGLRIGCILRCRKRDPKAINIPVNRNKL